MSMRLASAAAFATLTVASVRASAGEPEAIHLLVTTHCAAEADVVSGVAALGGELREPREDERARRLDVTIAKGKSRIDVRLVVHDLVGRVTERQVTSEDCAGAVKAASLLVALALDEPQPERPLAAPSAPPPTFWPAPQRDRGTIGGTQLVPAPRTGSGGLALTGMFGLTDGAGLLAGVRALAVERVGDSTRLGFGLTLSWQDRSFERGGEVYSMKGWSGWAGAAIGWGAPWNDSVVGLGGELGVAAGEEHGKALASWWGCRPGACGSQFDERPTSARYVSPFTAWTLYFQVPMKRSRVRPVAGLMGSFIPFEPNGSVYAFGTTLGAVWQGW